jgi:hypothetical protein
MICENPVCDECDYDQTGDIWCTHGIICEKCLSNGQFCCGDEEGDDE